MKNAQKITGEKCQKVVYYLVFFSIKEKDLTLRRDQNKWKMGPVQFKSMHNKKMVKI